MYLFTRRRRIDPAHAQSAMPWCVETGATVGEMTGLDVTVWGSFMSRDLGMVVWSTWAEHLSDLEKAFDKLLTSDSYNQRVAEGSELFVGPAEDGIARPLAGQPAEGGPPPYVTSVRAATRGGAMREALAVGAEIAQTASSITGADTMFVLEETGTYGGVGWITGHDGIEAIERSQDALAGNDSWLALVDRAGAVFQEGATQEIFRRLG